MEPVFFSSPSAFRNWLEVNHTSATELVVGFYKISSGKPSMTWPESVDEALCFGWIDGVRKSLGSESYCIRFTPRKQKSTWSAVNISNVEKLIQQGRMQPAGLASFEKREESNSAIYSYENEPVALADEFESRFRQQEQAWAYFQSQAPSYRKRAVHWVMNARQEATKHTRLEKLIAASEAGQRV